MLNFLKKKSDLRGASAGDKFGVKTFSGGSLSISNPLNINVQGELFIENNIESTMVDIADDILEPYKIENSFIPVVKGAFPYEYKNISLTALTLRQVVILSLLGEDICINLIKLNSIGTERNILIAGMPDDNGLVSFSDKMVKPIKSLYITPFYSKSSIDLLKLCFNSLLNIYKRQDRIESLDSKLVFKMNGFHALFTQPKNDEEEAVAMANQNRVIENFNNILSGNGAVIDAKDDLGFISNNGENKNESAKTPSDAIYYEISRILGVPISRLIGRSPQGMNATGEYDDKNYEKRLDSYREGWLEPILDFFEIKSTRVEVSDVEYLKNIATLCDMAEVPMPIQFKGKVKQVAENS